MDHGRDLKVVDGFAQERGFFADAFHQMDGGPFPACEGAGDDDPRKARAGSEIDPAFGVRRQRQELERIGDVTRPDVRDGRTRNQVDMGRNIEELVDEQVQFRRCFT